MPGSWGIVGMTVVDSITQLAVSAGNAAISTFTFTSQLASERLRAFRSATSIDPKQRVQVPGAPVNSSPNGISTLPNDSSLTDPALLEAPIVLQLATTLQQLISGGEGGKPDWEKIRRRGDVCRLYPLSTASLTLGTAVPEWRRLRQTPPTILQGKIGHKQEHIEATGCIHHLGS